MTARYTGDAIENVPNTHKIEFNVNFNGYNTTLHNYQDVTRSARGLSSSRDEEMVKNSIYTILDTVIGDPLPQIYTIHVTGNFHGFELDLVLLAVKIDNYLYAVQAYGKWRETKNPKVYVVSATVFLAGFSGSYSDLYDGLADAKIGFGFVAFSRACIG